MPRGYWIVRLDVHDVEAFRAYRAANGPPIAAFGGRFLVRNGTSEAVLGTARGTNVIVEFPSYADALGCWQSEAYQEVRALWRGGVEAEFLVIEGYEGAQPGEHPAAEPQAQGLTA